MTKTRINHTEIIKSILETVPDARNSDNFLISVYRNWYGSDIKASTILGIKRTIQNQLGLFPPSEKVKNYREEKLKEIVFEVERKKKQQEREDSLIRAFNSLMEELEAMEKPKPSLLSRFKRFIGIE